MAAIPTRAAREILTPAEGKTYSTAVPRIAPTAPPMVRSGARVPPDVPLPKAIAQEINFKIQSDTTS